ncbi:uncharacterized protein C8A04DRAFT_12364 [Dichotomopilus funicola]|uniref:Uncharacterized protein n=1 Tax=Dichotomopilus funicola TaxID=1934379 RepID=A0AAN6ZLA8_9PEZI|nr:hypothetical protein C8A04DRAFT_12364 [Dichotomopilus funicola]
MSDSPFTTPKRKRSEMLEDGALKLNTASIFTFDPNSPSEDGNDSPRTRVAHRFRGLALGGGGGGFGMSMDSATVDNDNEDASRKRVKLPDVHMADVETLPSRPALPSLPRRRPSIQRASPIAPKPLELALDEAVVGQSETIANTSTHDDDDNDSSTTSTTAPSLAPPTPPPVTAEPVSQSRNRSSKKRAGTPPFLSAKLNTTKTSTTPSNIVDPLRASLTWHDDEITIYDPDDSDDDGTGINGIGFKPTPAIAYARTMRRRQQLAEYRKREERDARAKRSMRRRGASPAPGPTTGAAAAGVIEKKKVAKEERRRVRFLEREAAVTAAVGELIGV